MLLPSAKVPMDIIIMNAEDRTGRGSDHIPFRQRSFTAIRLTSANENGNANASDTAYKDRQHTSDDILGLDTKPAPGLDSFFVDFNYLHRNTLINACGIAMAAIGPLTPDLNAVNIYGNTVVVSITAQTQYKKYRIGVRSLTNDWDSVYTFTNKLADTIIINTPGRNIFSVASVDDNGIESLFSREIIINKIGISNNQNETSGIVLLPNKPNPADEETMITVVSEKEVNSNSYLIISDINGKIIRQIPIELKQGTNEVIYNHGFHTAGIFFCSLYVDGRLVRTEKMVFNN